MRALFVYIFVLFICSCAQKQRVKNQVPKSGNLWTYEDARLYNKNQFDTAKWDMDLLQEEIAWEMDDWPTQSPIEHLPFPVAKYRAGYASKSISLSIQDKKKEGTTFATGTYNKYLEGIYDPEKQENFIFFNILILTDLPDWENASNGVYSRNYPHHTCQGRQKTSVGSVDWLAMHLATNEKFAVVNMKYFNLAFGQTILVAPQKNGSVRFKQIMLPNVSTFQIDKYVKELESDSQTVAFFMEGNNI